MLEDTISETTYIGAALFIYNDDSHHLIEKIQNNPFRTKITTATIEDFIQTPQKTLNAITHVVISGSVDDIKAVFKLAMELKFSIGWIPLDTQKELK